jgi:sigma-B regulation protein RsbU (phosphoserine phosphatase)
LNALIYSQAEPVVNLEERVRDLELDLERTTADFGDLARMGAILASFLRLEEVLATLMDMALRILGGQVGAIVLQTPDGPRPQVSWGLDHRVLPSIRWEGQPIAERTILKSRGALIATYKGPPIAVDGLVLHIETLISQPIITKSRTVGCVVIVNRQMPGSFTERDQLMLESLVNFASVAVENARLLSESLDKQRLEHELALAEQVQKTLVPCSNLTVGGATVESLYVPARGVGGDYFDILPMPDGSFFLAIGDVSSKGMAAALLMTAVRSVVRAATQRTDAVSQIVNEINRVVCKDLTDQKEMFITFFLARVEPARGVMTYTNAGHLPPLLWRADKGDISELGRGGVFLGQFADFEYTDHTAKFASGDRFLAFTDGIVEAADASGNLFGRERLEKFLRDHSDLPLPEFLKKLREDLERDFSHADYIDDVTAVFAEFGGEGG